MKNIKGIWFYGLSNSGKSFSSRYVKKKIKQKTVIVDGDEVRKFIL